MNNTLSFGKPQVSVEGTCPGSTEIEVLRSGVLLDRWTHEIREVEDVEVLSGGEPGRVACDQEGMCDFALRARPAAIDDAERAAGKLADVVVDRDVKVRADLTFEETGDLWTRRFADPGRDWVSLELTVAGDTRRLELPIVRPDGTELAIEPSNQEAK